MSNEALARAHNLKQTVIRSYLLLVTIEGLITAWSLTRIPADAKNALLFGMSAGRLILLGLTLLITLVSGWLLIKTWHSHSWFNAFEERFDILVNREKLWGLSILICIGLLIGGGYFILLTPEINEPFTQAYFIRLRPLIAWATILGGQTLLALGLIRFGFDHRRMLPRSRAAWVTLALFSLFLILWLWVALSGYGITATDAGAGWYYLGAPILETQALLAWGISMGLIGLWFILTRDMNKLIRLKAHPVWIDLILSLFIWLIAVILWASIPLSNSWFVAPPNAPNYEYYPQSDASLYDTTAQNALVGMGFRTKGSPAALRPMYALFLVILHQLGGPGYEPIILMQVAVLALFPVLVYWLTKSLYNRLGAMIAAALIILREANSIALMDAITVSNVKLLMSDFPAALGAVLFMLIMVRWMQDPDRKNHLLIIAGGVTGAFMLIRIEFAVFLASVSLVALIMLRQRFRYWFKSMVLVAVGLLLMISPWIYRNWRLTGIVYFDSPHFRADLVAKRYSDTPGETPPTKKPEETVEEFTDRMTESAADYVKENPREVSNFIVNHFFNSEIQSVMMFPTTFRLGDSVVGFLGHKSGAQFWEECCSSDNFIRRLPFWHKWDGSLPKQSLLPLLLTLFLLAFGLSFSWERNKLIGLAPFIASIAYLLANAIVRNSGGRYVLAVDWSAVIYYSIGLAQVSLWTLDRLGIKVADPLTDDGALNEAQAQPAIKETLLPCFTKTNLGLAAVILLIGCSLPLAEKVFPARYSETSKQEGLASLLSQDAGYLDTNEIETLEAFLDDKGKVIEGNALYPQYYAADKGETSSGWIDEATQQLFLPKPYSRALFYMVGPRNTTVIVSGAEDVELPHASDVLVIGCVRKWYINAVAVLVYPPDDSPAYLIKRSPLPSELRCPLPAP
jgi:hypothetical protein